MTSYYFKNAPNPENKQYELSPATVFDLFSKGLDTIQIAIKLNHFEHDVYNTLAKLDGPK